MQEPLGREGGCPPYRRAAYGPLRVCNLCHGRVIAKDRRGQHGMHGWRVRRGHGMSAGAVRLSPCAVDHGVGPPQAAGRYRRGRMAADR